MTPDLPATQAVEPSGVMRKSPRYGRTTHRQVYVSTLLERCQIDFGQHVTFARVRNILIGRDCDCTAVARSLNPSVQL